MCIGPGGCQPTFQAQPQDGGLQRLWVWSAMGEGRGKQYRAHLCMQVKHANIEFDVSFERKELQGYVEVRAIPIPITPPLSPPPPHHFLCLCLRL